MHELSVCLSLLQQVEKVAREHDAANVTRIILSVGPLSGVEPELLRRAYPLAVAGTVAADAELVMESADIIVQCSQCGSETNALPNKLLCGNCGDYRTQIVSGDELTLMTVELDTTSGLR